jgi:hypothetical protein
MDKALTDALRQGACRVSGIPGHFVKVPCQSRDIVDLVGKGPPALVTG